MYDHTCEICEEEFDSKEELREHYETEHPDEDWPDEDDENDFESPGSFSRGINILSGIRFGNFGGGSFSGGGASGKW